MLRILVPLDGSQVAEDALAHALAVARSFKAHIDLLQVVDTPRDRNGSMSDPSDQRMRIAQAQCYLDGIRERENRPDLVIETAIREGSAAEQIIAFAHDSNIDLIALTAFGRGGAANFVHGSTVHKILSGAGVSVLLVHPEESRKPDTGYRKVLVPLDGSYRTDWALCLATSIARAHDAELVLIQVVQTPQTTGRLPISSAERGLVERLIGIQKSDAEHHLRELEAQLPDDLRRSTRVVVAEEASREIEAMAQSEDIGLLVLSAHGLSNADCWLYGPVSETLINYSTRPLLVLQDNLPMDDLVFEPNPAPLTVNG